MHVTVQTAYSKTDKGKKKERERFYVFIKKSFYFKIWKKILV